MPKVKLTYTMRSEVTIEVTEEQMAEIDEWLEENEDDLPVDTNVYSLPEVLDVDGADITEGITECELEDIDELKERKKSAEDTEDEEDGP